MFASMKSTQTLQKQSVLPENFLKRIKEKCISLCMQELEYSRKRREKRIKQQKRKK